MLLRVLGVLGQQQSGALSPDRFQFASHCLSASLASDAVGFVYRQSDCCFHCQSQCAVGRVQSSWSCSRGSDLLGMPPGKGAKPRPGAGSQQPRSPFQETGPFLISSFLVVDSESVTETLVSVLSAKASFRFGVWL